MHLTCTRGGHIMFRSAFINVALILGLGAFAQAQVVNSGGYVTTAPSMSVVGVAQNSSVVNAQGAPSVPAISTPVAHVGPQAGAASQPGQATNGLDIVATEGAQQNTNSATSQAFNFGAATLSSNPYVSGGVGASEESLAEAARQAKQKEQNVNARVYTNADIDRINQATGVNAVATDAANSYPANNGVITPPSNNQNSIAVPAQNQSTTGTVQTAPGPQNPAAQPPVQPAPNAPAAAQPFPPQANAKPSANTSTMASNHPPAPLNQANDSQQGAGTQQLPKTASRLPLIGVLGFFSISMGIFVRYQRAKSSK